MIWDFLNTYQNIIGLIVGAMLGYFLQRKKNKAQIENMNQQTIGSTVDVWRNMVNQLRDDVKTLTIEMVTLRDQNKALTLEVSNLRIQNEDLTKEVGKLRFEVQKLHKENLSLKSKKQ